jgi:hypothetical protein
MSISSLSNYVFPLPLWCREKTLPEFRQAVWRVAI